MLSFIRTSVCILIPTTVMDKHLLHIAAEGLFANSLLDEPLLKFVSPCTACCVSNSFGSTYRSCVVYSFTLTL